MKRFTLLFLTIFVFVAPSIAFAWGGDCPHSKNKVTEKESVEDKEENRSLRKKD